MPFLRAITSPDGSVIVTIDDQEVLKSIGEMPKAFNQGMNRAVRGLGSAFGRQFTRERLGRKGAGIRVNRSSQSKNPKGQPALPPRMRAFGFKARLEGAGDLGGKRMFIRTRSPVALGHQLGEALHGKDGKSLRVRFSKIGDVTPEEKRNAFIVRIKGRTFLVAKHVTGHVGFSGADKYTLIPLAHFKRTIRMIPRLQFLETWDRFVPEAVLRLAKGLTQTMERLGRRPEEPELGEEE